MSADFSDFLKQLESNVTAAPVVAAPAVAAPAGDFSNFLKQLESNVTAAPSGKTDEVHFSTKAPVVTGQKKLKFLLVSTHCHQVTGYSKVSYGIIQELAKCNGWLDVAHYGFQKMPNRDYSDVRPYPASVKVYDGQELEKAGQNPNKQGFGYAELPRVIQEYQPNVVMIYNDMAVITQFMNAIKQSGIKRDFSTWLYVDQVYTMQLNGYIEMINKEADRVFAFTQMWKDCLKDQGVHRPIDVLGHGFDPKMFYTVSKEEARRKLGLPNDLFLFMSLNRNQPRKRYDLMIMAFVELLVKYPTKPIALMCVCDKGEKGGWWLFEIFVRELKLRNVPVERFGNRLLVTSREMDYKDEEINTFYNAADVGLSAADGEGWGLCTFEQMGVGVPQIVPAVGGYREFCSPENSVMVKPKHRFYMPMAYCPVGGEAAAVDPHDLCLGMEQYVNDSGLKARHGVAAKEKVLKYTWAEVTKNLVRRLKARAEEDD
jgi:glycosyltransferase involved in cell wall biosynthesis